jgi:hypothetical protein
MPAEISKTFHCKIMSGFSYFDPVRDEISILIKSTGNLNMAFAPYVKSENSFDTKIPAVINYAILAIKKL